MEKTTILDKFKIIFEISKSSKLFIAVIAFIILLAIVALTTNKKNAKRGKSIYALVYASILVSLVVVYHESLGKMFDYMMNNFFIVLYFPNVAVYMAAIVITNIILWTSVFNFKTSKLVRTINVIVYGIIHYFLALVLNVISKNGLDIFSQASIYGNKEAQAIIELTSGVFIVWIIFLVLYRIIRNYQRQNVVVPVKQKVVVKNVRKLPENVKEVEVPLFVKAQPRKETPKEKTEEPIIFDQFVDAYNTEKQALEKQLIEAQEQLAKVQKQVQIQEESIRINNEEINRFQQQKLSFEDSYTKLYEQQKEQLKLEQIKIKQEQEKLEQEKQKLASEKQKQTTMDATTAIMQNLDSMFTLEDYKVLATILKEKQKKKKIAKEKNEVRNLEQLKFAQLREAYRSAK